MIFFIFIHPHFPVSQIMDLRSLRNSKSMMKIEKLAYRSFLVWPSVLGFFLVGLWLVWQETPPNTYSTVMLVPPYLKSLQISSGFEDQSSQTVRHEKLSVIRGVPLKGEAVESFRAHLDCFSESGKWVYNSTPRFLPWNGAGDPYASQCDGRHSSVSGNAVGEWADILASNGGNWTVREELKWVWRTSDKCPLVAIDRDDFCRLVGAYGNVLVVGDSINHLLQWSLINNLLKNRSDPNVVIDSSNCRTCPSFEVCSDIAGPGKKGFKIGFVRNDRISAISNFSSDTLNNFLEWPWIHLLREWDIHILLMNRGAHFESDEIFSESLHRTFSLLHSLYPDLLVLFRNTPPGHENCTSYRGPISERQVIKKEKDKFHWSEFERQNALAKKIVEEYEYIYMDVDVMLSKRPDGHINDKDCLHYCIPGPLDSVVELFYNILKLLRPRTTHLDRRA